MSFTHVIVVKNQQKYPCHIRYMNTLNVISLAVLLEAPDTVLIERAAGKRRDPVSGGLYPLVKISICFAYVTYGYTCIVIIIYNIKCNILDISDMVK